MEPLCNDWVAVAWQHILIYIYKCDVEWVLDHIRSKQATSMLRWICEAIILGISIGWDVDELTKRGNAHQERKRNPHHAIFGYICQLSNTESQARPAWVLAFSFEVSQRNLHLHPKLVNLPHFWRGVLQAGFIVTSRLTSKGCMVPSVEVCAALVKPWDISHSQIQRSSRMGHHMLLIIVWKKNGAIAAGFRNFKLGSAYCALLA